MFTVGLFDLPSLYAQEEVTRTGRPYNARRKTLMILLINNVREIHFVSCSPIGRNYSLVISDSKVSEVINCLYALTQKSSLKIKLKALCTILGYDTDISYMSCTYAHIT